jgi:RNA polymerase sigma-70 factor (ECF subfamily)
LQVQDTTPEAEVTAQHLHDTLACELSRMSEKNRVAYILLREEHLTAREAAAVLGTTVEAVKQRAHRAYQSLRAALNTTGWSEYGNDPV